MPSPFDYSLNQQGNTLMGGYNAGFAQAQQSQEQARQQEMQRMAEAVKLQQQQQQIALQNRIASVADGLKNGTASGNDIASLMVAAPQLSEGFKRAYDALSESGQKSLKSAGFQIDAALDAGDTAVLNTVLDRNIEAFKNSGDPSTANSLAAIKKVAETDVGRAKLLAKMFNASIDPKYAENLSKLGAEARAAESAPVELATKKAQQTIAESEAGVSGEKAALTIKQMGANLKLTGAQIAQANAAAAASKAAADRDKLPPQITPAQKFDAEAKLRKEYADQTKNYSEVSEAYKRVKSADNNGAGDIALIYGYMKMLDPGSVVREGEFATASNTSGVPAGVMNAYNKAMNGQRLTEGQRKTFLAQAAKYHDAALEKEQTVRKTLEPVAKGYGLDPKNIFYGESPSKEVQPTPPAGKPAAKKPIEVNY
jgi:hypothetical protein